MPPSEKWEPKVVKCIKAKTNDFRRVLVITVIKDKGRSSSKGVSLPARVEAVE
jgi:hypothetical protein